MKIDHFDPPANIDDLDTPALKAAWTKTMSANFETTVRSVQAHLDDNGGGTCQFYNPLLAGLTGPDLPPSAGTVPWNGFPKRLQQGGPGGGPDFAGAEPVALPPDTGRPQDEYLEWHVTRNAAHKIVSVEFTCEGYDYYQFLAKAAPDKLLFLYKTFISPSVQKADLFHGDGSYNRFNHWNIRDGAMHLTNDANNLFAEVFLAGSATVRRKNQTGAEVTASVPLTRCSGFGDPGRNSDPAIGAAVNSLARQGRMITLANPVGLYIGSFDGAGFHLPDGSSASGFFQILRGQPGRTLRAVYKLPDNLAATGLTVSDVKINGTAIEFGGQIAQRITMQLTGIASVDQSIHNPLLDCGSVAQVNAAAPHLAVAAEAATSHASLRGVA